MHTNQRGYIALTSVLIILVVVLTISVVATYTTIGEARSGLSLVKGESNLHFVEGCVEDYLLRIRNDANYVGAVISQPEGSCNITITSRTPSWDITVFSVNTEYQRKIRVVFTRNASGITINSWTEV